MARIKLGNGVEDIRGRAAGQVYSAWRPGVNYIQMMPIQKPKSKTAAQKAAREYQAKLAGRWRWLGDNERADWENASKMKRYRRNPESGIRAIIRVSANKMSGFNAFMEANQLAHSVGRNEIIASPKLTEKAPSALPEFDAVLDKDGLIIGWKPANTAAVSQFLRIWIYSEQGKFHKQLAGVAPMATGKTEIRQVRISKGSIVPIGDYFNTAVLIQVDVVDQETGWQSAS